MAEFISGMTTDDNGNLVNTNDSFFIGSRLDDAWDEFMEDKIKPIMEGFSSNVNKLTNLNKRYFDSINKGANHQSIKDQVLSTIGISGTVVLGGSLLYSILTDREVISTIKSIVFGSIGAGITVTALRVAVEEIVARKDGGLIKNLFEKTIPDPYVKLDRFIGGKYATDLQLNYAIYQGGIIKTSRDFCIVRNNKVFSRDEILKFGTSSDEFGGYTNKATGEFQGKTDPYNPFLDLGGYNCRHQFDWVSDELAFNLRPELRNG